MSEPDQREQLAPPAGGRGNSRIAALLTGSGVVLATLLASLATLTHPSNSENAAGPITNASTDMTNITSTAGSVDTAPATITPGTTAASSSTDSSSTTATATGRHKVVIVTSGPHGPTTIVTETDDPTPTTKPTTTKPTTTEPTTTTTAPTATPTTTSDPAPPNG